MLKRQPQHTRAVSSLVQKLHGMTAKDVDQEKSNLMKLLTFDQSQIDAMFDRCDEISKDPTVNTDKACYAYLSDMICDQWGRYAQCYCVDDISMHFAEISLTLILGMSNDKLEKSHAVKQAIRFLNQCIALGAFEKNEFLRSLKAEFENSYSSEYLFDPANARQIKGTQYIPTSGFVGNLYKQIEEIAPVPANVLKIEQNPANPTEQSRCVSDWYRIALGIVLANVDISIPLNTRNTIPKCCVCNMRPQYLFTNNACCRNFKCMKFASTKMR